MRKVNTIYRRFLRKIYKIMFENGIIDKYSYENHILLESFNGNSIFEDEKL